MLKSGLHLLLVKCSLLPGWMHSLGGSSTRPPSTLTMHRCPKNASQSDWVLMPPVYKDMLVVYVLILQNL